MGRELTISKSAVLYRYGGPEVLEITDRAVEDPAPGEVLIRMVNAGVARPDLLMRTGVYPWTRDILPFYPGIYGAGYIECLGEGVTDLAVGQAVYVEHPVICGCCAEYKTAPADYILPLPDGLDMSLAAITNSTQIAWGMLTECFPDAHGKTLYIQGAAGALGTAVIQLAPLLGLRIIASASTEEKCAYLRFLGCADVFCYRNADVGKTVLEYTDGRGADIIMDQSVGEAFISQLDFLAPMGTVLIYNNTKGSPSADVIGAMTDRFGNCPGIRAFSFHYFDNKRALLRQKKEEVFSLLRDGKVRPHIGGRFPLEDIRRAHQLLDSGDFFGGIVIDCQ